jgi:hypothetical protein
LQEKQREIEIRLAERERRLYSLEEKIILYDLTNTYLTGLARKSRKARRGRSKQKRNNCPLVTLGIGHIAKASGNQTFSRVKICSGHKMQGFRASETHPQHLPHRIAIQIPFPGLSLEPRSQL